MQRVLPSDEIARSVAQPIPRLCLPDRATVFGRRAARLDQLASDHPLSGYLRLMAAVARAQQELLAALPPRVIDAAGFARAAAHRMPVLPAGDHRRQREWPALLAALCERLAAQDQPAPVADLLRRVQRIPAAVLDEQADALLGGRPGHADPASAPFLMAALQVCWTSLAAALDPAGVAPLDVPGVCPVCGSLPVASVVHGNGHRYLHCALCASEWHLVRAKCSHCDAVEGIAYRFIEHGNDGVRAETCEQCRAYRKVLLQEKDPQLEAVADDLASLALDVLVGEAGYHRASVNPMLWPSAEG